MIIEQYQRRADKSNCVEMALMAKKLYLRTISWLHNMENYSEKQMFDMVRGLTTEPKNKAGLFLCTRGEADVMIGQRVYKVRPGVLYVINPIIVVVKLSQSDDYAGIYILDRLEVFFPMVRSMANTIVGLRVYNNPCQVLKQEEIHFISERSKYISEKEKELEACVMVEEKELRARVIELVKQQTMLEVICIYLRGRELLPQQEDTQVGKFFTFILSLLKNYRRHREVRFYAEEVGLSCGHFSNVIKQKTGMTPSTWIARITISNAQILLCETQMSIKEIAMELNFPEQFTFRKYFKTHIGMSPREYRRRHGMDKRNKTL